MTTVAVGDSAPPIELETVEGERRSLAQTLPSGPVLAVFLKTTCGTCDLALPYLNRLVEVYGEDGWHLWAISQDPAGVSKEYGERFGLRFDMLVDGEGWPASKAYDPPSTPTFFLVAPDGSVEFASAAFSKEDLNEIAGWLAGHLGREPEIIAEPGDGNPDFRPG